MGGVGFSWLSQTHVARAVALRFGADLKLCLCPVYLVLKSFSVLPIYFCVPCCVCKVASYITASVWHCPFSGQFSFCLQLHGLSSFVVVLLISLLLWLCMWAFMFFVVL